MGKYFLQVKNCGDVRTLIPYTKTENLNFCYDCFAIDVLEAAADQIVDSEDGWYRPWGNITNQNIYFAMKTKPTNRKNDSPLGFQICIYRKSKELKSFVENEIAPMIENELGIKRNDKHLKYIVWETSVDDKTVSLILDIIVPKLIDIAKRKLGLIK